VVVIDGWFAKARTLSSDYSRFLEWKNADGINIVNTETTSKMEPMLKLNKKTLLDVIRELQSQF